MGSSVKHAIVTISSNRNSYISLRRLYTMVIAISRLSINYIFPKVTRIIKTYLILFLQDPKRKRRGARVETLLLNLRIVVTESIIVRSYKI